MTKRKITLSIDQILIDWVDSFVEKSNFRYSDRSHLISYAIATLKDIEEKKI